MSYHYYCLVLSLAPLPSNRSIPVIDRVLCDEIEGPALFRSVQNDLIQTGGSSFLTEFGGCENSPVCDEQLDWGLIAADQFLQSWAFWGNSYADLRTIKRLSRVYARAIAGKPITMQFLADQRLFFLSYYIDVTIKQATEIVVPPVQYPQSSYIVTVNDPLMWTIDSTDPNIVRVEPNARFLKSKEQIALGVITIRPRV